MEPAPVLMRKYPLLKTEYKGVYYINGTDSLGDPEKIYYIMYYRDGRRHHESAGREKKHGMTAKKAHYIRADKERGLLLPNKVRRQEELARKMPMPVRYTFDKLFNEYAKVNAGKSGLYNDRNRYKVHIQPLFGNKIPIEVMPTDIDSLRGNLRDKKYAVGTVISILSLLRRIARFGAKRRMTSGLKFELEFPRGAKEKTEDMTTTQMQAYIKTCREWLDPQAGDFQLFEIYTGVRRGEARNLKWTDVDFDRGFILLRDPKGGVDAKIPMSDAVVELLKGHLHKGTNPYVFSGRRRNGRRGIKQIAAASRAIRDAAGLPEDFRPNHGLRHTFASMLASSGEVDLYTIQRLLTHKSPTMTQRYAHLRDTTLKAGANVMGRVAKKVK